VLAAALSLAAAAAAADREFEIRRDTLVLKDGVRLSATYFLPRPQAEGERFPVLLEFLPYRKDDSFYLRDYPNHGYWARNGLASAKVDLRGTGSSEGVAPDREYSQRELDDAVEIIAQLARMPWSNGNVGMWGISWGGFNAIQVAMRRPPALKAILAAAAADNVYRDSVDYIDGAFHVDSYHLQVHHEAALPRSPAYVIDDAYFRDRFDRKPWFFTYLRHQQDGPFWRKSALQFDPSKLRVPAYLIGGLLDGYRDAIPRMLEHASAPILAEIGPWNHSWPDDGTPGPNHEWGRTAVAFWKRWLGAGAKAPAGPPEKRFAVFVRDAHEPDARIKTTPGHWRYEEWPIRRTAWRTLYPAPDGALAASAPASGEDRLRYAPGYGIAAGLWWGEPTGDMRPDDAGSLVYDGPLLTESFEIVGLPRVRLRARVDAPLAHFVARLEDVHPDGRVSLVAAALLNGAQRSDPLRPQPLVSDQATDLAFDLHFTTWTFRPGHRVRLAVTNAQFPMIWPTPHAMTTTLMLGEGTGVSLPVVPTEAREAPAWTPPEPRPQRTDARYGECESWPNGTQEWTRDQLRGEVRYDWRTACAWELDAEGATPARRFLSTERNVYTVDEDDPARAGFRGDESHTIELPGRRLELRTTLEVRSDASTFYVVFTRRILENERLLREKQWTEDIPRELQ
jgi:predicted acyl esterase